MASIEHQEVCIRCGFCGHFAPVMQFCRTEIGGALPAGHFQCPACRKAWRVRRPKEGELCVSGGYVFTLYPDHPHSIREPDDRLVRMPTVM